MQSIKTHYLYHIHFTILILILKNDDILLGEHFIKHARTMLYTNYDKTN